MISGEDVPPSMLEEVRFIKRNNFKYCSMLEIEEEISNEQVCIFRIAGKRQPNRVLRVSLTKETAYSVIEDTNGVLVGRVFESYEQIMSELDAGGFGDLLCGLAAEKLAGLAALESEQPNDDNSGQSADSGGGVLPQFHQPLDHDPLGGDPLAQSNLQSGAISPIQQHLGHGNLHGGGHGGGGGGGGQLNMDPNMFNMGTMVADEEVP